MRIFLCLILLLAACGGQPSKPQPPPPKPPPKTAAVDQEWRQRFRAKFERHPQIQSDLDQIWWRGDCCDQLLARLSDLTIQVDPACQQWWEKEKAERGWSTNP